MSLSLTVNAYYGTVGMEWNCSCYLSISSWGPNHNVTIVIHTKENAVDMLLCMYTHMFVFIRAVQHEFIGSKRPFLKPFFWHLGGQPDGAEICR